MLRLDSFKIWLTCSRELGIHNFMAWVLLCMAGGRQRKIRVAPNDSGYSVIKTKQNGIRTAGRRAASQAGVGQVTLPDPPPRGVTRVIGLNKWHVLPRLTHTQMLRMWRKRGGEGRRSRRRRSKKTGNGSQPSRVGQVTHPEPPRDLGDRP